MLRKSKRNKSRKPSVLRGVKPTLEALEERKLLAVVSFQQGVSGYAAQEDTVLYSREPDVNFGTEGSISPDQQDSNGVRQGLLQFGDIIGDAGNQIPLGAKINSATLTVDVVNDSNSAMQMSLYRMQEDWSESTATWNTFGAIGGVQASEGESSDLPPDAILFDPDTSANSPTAGIFDVSRSLEYWVAGDGNFGWMIESAATNGWDFRTKESAVSQRPRLTVDFSVPTNNEFAIISSSIVAAEGNTGGNQTAIVEVARMGDLGAATSVDFSVTAGTAGADDFVEIPSGTLDFAAGEALATIEVTINGDDTLEGLETIDVALTSGNITTGRGTSTITIADDDALINEVLANVSSNDDETDREYIELLGTPGASLDDYYFVVFEGEEEEGGAGGVGTGVADYVVPLSGQSFGTNGLLVIAPTNWEYQANAAAGTNIFNTASLDGAGGILEDNSQTYALIRSPNAAIVQGTDYDTVGTYENDTNQAIGTGVGILDQLPSGADLVDSVGVVEGGGGDRDRVLTTDLLGHPGAHVHQPTGTLNDGSPGGNVTSDAVSRREGQTLPNSIGVWFNGDIPDGDLSGGPIRYINDSFQISVVAPDGSVLTPGQPNTLRTVFFSLEDQNKEVAEADGSVTVRIERTGDLDEVITVSYETVDLGSATPDADFTAVSDSVVFGVGESFKDVTITILSDSVAEGFERFGIDITDVTGGDYLITNGKSNESGAINGESVITIADANVSIATFQDGVDGYDGTSDAYLDGESLTLRFGQDPVVRVDQVKGEGEDVPPVVRPQQGLIRFDDMFGDQVNQVPAGSTIFGAFLTVNVQNVASGADVRFFRMQQDWEQVNATWLDPQGQRGSTILNGVTPDDIEAAAEPDARVPDPGRAGLVEIPLDVDTIQAWANGSLDNYGWSIVSDAGSLWAFNSSESFLVGTSKPELTILYTAPEAANAGSFGLSVDDYSVNEDGTATITVNRKGGSTGAVSLDWALSAGTADLSDVSGATSGTVNFAEGELFQTFDIAIDDDIAVEANETLTISLSGNGVDLSRAEATLTIRDNDFNPFLGDLLLNELWINSPGNDPPHEFVEIKGTPGVGMGSLYYVAIEGLVGDREGSAEKVVDIGTFSNGSSGYTLLTPDAADFAFNVPVGTTQVDGLGSIATENVSSQNDSTTYMLLYSPFTRLATTEFDYDWDNDGALELPPGVQIVDSVGVRVLGAQDQLYGPGTNQASFDVSDPDVDAISRDRNSTSPNQGDDWFGGDLFPAGDDYLLYETNEAFGLPVTGTALTPGEVNTGSNVESPVATLQSVNVNGDGTVSVIFSDPVSQFNVGDGGSQSPSGAGITVTDTSGNVLPTIDAIPTVGGLGTDTLTLSFTGADVVGGVLPPGTYQLNFVGNALIANGRAVDVASDGSQINGFFTEEIMIDVTNVSGDFDADGDWDCDDINALSAEIAAGTNDPAFDMNGDGAVTLEDITDANVGWLAIGGANNAGVTGGNAFIQGDADLSGAVDVSDFNIWNNNKFTSTAAYCSGDFNADGVVDVSDFNIWNGTKFTSSSRPDAGVFLAQDAGFAATAERSGQDAQADEGTNEVAAPKLQSFDRDSLTEDRTRSSRSSRTETGEVDALFAVLGEG